MRKIYLKNFGNKLKNTKKNMIQIDIDICDFKVYQLLAQYFHFIASLSISNQKSLVQIDIKVCNRENTRKLLGKLTLWILMHWRFRSSKKYRFFLNLTSQSVILTELLQQSLQNARLYLEYQNAFITYWKVASHRSGHSKSPEGYIGQCQKEFHRICFTGF